MSKWKNDNGVKPVFWNVFGVHILGAGFYVFYGGAH